MTLRQTDSDDPLHAYLLAHSLRESAALTALREDSIAATGAQSYYAIAPEQGQFMALVVELTGARRILELGAFTGYSALAMALAMPDDGRLVTCDVSEEWTAIARRHWAAAGVAHRIELRLVPALDMLTALLAEGRAGGFDLAFIDAVKEEYDAYYEHCLQLVRPGGLIMVDNVLWSGRVADPAVSDEKTRAIRAFNDKLHADPRVSLAMVPVGDGLTLARRR